MKEYTFEYVDERLLSQVIYTSIAMLISLVATTMLFFYGNKIALTLGITGCSIFPTWYFLSHKSTIKKQGVALIGYGRLVFDLSDNTRVISLSDITRYRISYRKGTRLLIESKNGKPLHLFSTNNFCDTTSFDLLCKDINTTINTFKYTI